jgi:hypothetical protein
LWISDNGELGTDLIKGAIPMTYLNDEFWVADIKIKKKKLPHFITSTSFVMKMARSFLSLVKIV